MYEKDVTSYKNSLGFVYWNVQGLDGKVYALESFLIDFINVYFICISDHWLNQNEICMSFPEGYYTVLVLFVGVINREEVQWYL